MAGRTAEVERHEYDFSGPDADYNGQVVRVYLRPIGEVEFTVGREVTG